MVLVGSSTTVMRQKIEASLPRKRGAAASGYDKALESFFAKVSALGFHGGVYLCCFCSHSSPCSQQLPAVMDGGA